MGNINPNIPQQLMTAQELAALQGTLQSEGIAKTSTTRKSQDTIDHAQALLKLHQWGPCPDGGNPQLPPANQQALQKYLAQHLQSSTLPPDPGGVGGYTSYGTNTKKTNVDTNPVIQNSSTGPHAELSTTNASVSNADGAHRANTQTLHNASVTAHNTPSPKATSTASTTPATASTTPATASATPATTSATSTYQATTATRVSDAVSSPPMTTSSSSVSGTTGSNNTVGAIADPTMSSAAKASAAKWMQPGFMVSLYPILAQILTLVTEQIKTGAQLNINMLALGLAYAQASMQSAIDAGQAQYEQCQIEAKQFSQLAIADFIQAGLQFGQAVATGISYGIVKAWTNNSLKNQYSTTGLDGEPVNTWNPATDKSQQALLDTRVNTNLQSVNGMINGLFGSAQSFTQGWTQLIQANAKQQVATQILDGAKATALSQYLDKLAQTIQNTIQTAIEMGKSADEIMQQILQLLKTEGETVQKIYAG